MMIFYKWAEALRCPTCALVGVASVAEKIANGNSKIERLPEGFKIIKTPTGEKVYCAACDHPARSVAIDP
ncbi:MAG: hypothetical protein NVSMB6_24700 [Burkholderiaceae bacterium]